MKLTMQLASKDTIIDEKANEIDSLNNHSKLLVEQIATSKSTGAERVASLEKAIQLLKQEVEEARATKSRELESQRAYLQKEVDQAIRTSEDMNSHVLDLNSQLEKIKHDQENEATRLSSYISKSLTAIELANSTSQKAGLNSNVLVESQSNIGFSKMTIRALVRADGTIERK